MQSLYIVEAKVVYLALASVCQQTSRIKTITGGEISSAVTNMKFFIVFYSQSSILGRTFINHG